MTKKKSLIISLLSIFVLSLFFTGCSKEDDLKDPETSGSQESSSESDEAGLKDGAYKSSAAGYGGELELEITIEDSKLTDINVLEHQETSPVFTRALTVAKERIIEAQSPEVDSVSGATFTSFAIKKATGNALNEAGADFDEVTMATQGEEETRDAKLDDETSELVIVGGGPAGLSAAVEAKEAGIDVILLEKLDILSGNGKFDMLIFDLLNSKMQNEDGIEYTIDDFKAKRKGNVVDSDERIDVWAQGAFELDEWFRSMNIELNHYYDEVTHMAEDDAYAGEHIQDNLEIKVHDLGVDVRTGAKATDLVVEDGVVKGVHVETKEGTYVINSDAVIVATGGFSHNKELLQKYRPGSEELMTSNQMGATGDLIPIFEKMNVGLAEMDTLSIFNPAMVKNRELTGARGDGFLFINKEGNRFVAEKGEDPLKLGQTILEQPDKQAFYIYDQPLYESFYRVQKHNKLGYHTKADSIQELAKELGIDADSFVETVEEYNKAVRGDVKDPYREEMPEREFDLNGPIYGVQVQSAVHMTKGGVTANEKTEALNTDGEVIKGLYAAGEVTSTGGIYKESFIFGRVAGQKAAEFIQDK